ncbi:MlaD family protein [Patulibacter brassicae]|uniref:MlaD family protein n=1 Tax=Patulibacter brassicae TaxID=1705717 RepID=A0ABU4VPJ1_9ACTN|nr:MlaD family protein [Patulibacter brassicae]MDX8153776.1 MlaD family protein [Patulibacter brassicae]
MRRAIREHARPVAVILLLALAGSGVALFVLVKQRLPVPFRDTYDVRVVVPSADGVAPGLGQSVDVSGVRVGSIAEARIVGRNAELTLRIDRGKLPRVHRDARADLRPITPLKDMQLDLDPGTERAPVLGEDERLPLERSSSPVPLADLLSQLDVDTRGFLVGLLDGVGRGTRDRAPDMRRLLLLLGPTSADVGAVAREVDGRRAELARLVSNVAAVTRAGAADGKLAEVVANAERTLSAVAAEDRPLRASLDRLPGTLRRASSTIGSVGRLSDELRRTSDALLPEVRRLPATLRSTQPFMRSLTGAMRRDIRPLVQAAQPLAGQLQPAVRNVMALTPDLSRVAQTTNYVLNEIGYNPPGKEEGMLFWLAWFAQNWNSSASTADAHGGILRVALNVNCQQMTQVVDLAPLFRLLTGTSQICPAS